MNDDAPTGLKKMFPTIAYAAAEADRLELKLILLRTGGWTEEHTRLDEEWRIRNLNLLPIAWRESFTKRSGAD